jgi:hypothetical protein
MEYKSSWSVLRKAGFASIPQMAQGLLYRVQRQDLVYFLKDHRVRRLLMGWEKRSGLAWLTAEDIYVNSMYRITLRPDRIYSWIEDLGHEIGHLFAWNFDSLPLSKGEENFAEIFGNLWASKKEERLKARKIFCRLIRE